MQSMKPPDGKLSSNIMMRRISSVSSRRLRMWEGLVEKVSVAVLSAAYAVEHLSEIMFLMRSNPIFCSSLLSIVLFFSSKSLCLLLFSKGCVQEKLQFVDVRDRRHFPRLDKGYPTGLFRNHHGIRVRLFGNADRRLVPHSVACRDVCPFGDRKGASCSYYAASGNDEGSVMQRRVLEEEVHDQAAVDCRIDAVSRADDLFK